MRVFGSLRGALTRARNWWRSTSRIVRRKLLPRTGTAWTSERIHTAISGAESGYLRELMTLLEYQRLSDDRIAPVLELRAAVCSAFSVTVETDREDVRQALLADWWDMVPETVLSRMTQEALYYGIAVAERTWWYDSERGRLLQRLTPWDADALKWQNGQLYACGDHGDVPITEGDTRWVVLSRFHHSRPWMAGLWRACLNPWLAKTSALRDWMRYCRRHGNPFVHGNLTDGDEAQFNQLADDVEALGGDTSSITTQGASKVELIEAKANTYGAMRDMAARADTALAVRVLGQNLTTQVAGASLAAAQVHDLVRQDILVGDENWLSTSIRAQVVTPWQRFNFGAGPVAWLRWQVARPEDKKAKADTQMRVLEVIEKARALNLPVDEKALMEAGGFNA